MAILKKPYTLAVYGDILQSDGSFAEERICIIGSDKMTFEGQAIEPELTRNVNGQNKLSFKMYKRFVDTATGEKVENPFIPWLISERKVKLEFEDKWYDFIIKDINENSSNYLYTYQLEDAVVQELSKNGFGTTLDAALMNNIGNSLELGKAIMAETDWDVEAEKIVETIEEALVYVTLPAGQMATHILDQRKDANGNYSTGIAPQTEKVNLGEKTVLAFYSSCKNKPHLFQFIYSDKGYDLTKNNHIERQDDRLISEMDCQYYIDYDNPSTKYSENIEALNLTLPENFAIVSSPSGDTTISSNYRGKRYAFAQQAIYVPLLDKYCSRFNKEVGNISVTPTLHYSGSGTNGIAFDGTTYTKNAEYSGIKLTIGDDYKNGETYKLSYTLTVTGGTLKNIGGHNWSFLTNFSVKGYGTTKNSYYTFNQPLTEGAIEVTAYYLKQQDDTDSNPYVFIQPNRGLLDEVKFSISNIQMTSSVEYLSYVDTEYVSPALVQNYINNYNFDSTAGWIVTAPTRVTLNNEPKITNCYGRFVDGKFVSMIDDFLSGKYSEDNTYAPYMQVTFTDSNQFVLNSGLRDNRTIIGNLEEGAELIADCEIVNSSNASAALVLDIGEYIYNQTSGGYDQRTGLISFTPEMSRGKKIFKVIDSSYTEETFKKDSKLYLKIHAPTTFSKDDNNQNIPQTFYIKKAQLYKKVVSSNGNYIVPDYDSDNSAAASGYVDNSVLKNTYKYFPRWLIDYNMVNSQEEIPLKTFEALTYETYKPIYNEGAEKIRTVSVKESNYFNNLQTIAETFEQWLVFEISRQPDGSINNKKVCFKNYRGKDNYACFRYGVNLQDIQRTYTSKNIVTKLIVKNNSNEHAEDGFCTIQRAGANPTGENYLYDFQYYQNQGIMPVDQYLEDVYYMDSTNSKGPDSVFWDGSMSNAPLEGMTLKGYYPRIKKLNDKLLPIGQALANKKIDLLSYQSEEEVAKSTYDAALSGMQTVREDFKALTGVYPEEAQNDKLKSISVKAFVPQDSWYIVDGSPSVNGNEITVNIKALASNSQVYPTPKFSSGTTTEQVTSPYVYKITKKSEWEGMYLDFGYQVGTEYILEYDLTLNTTKDITSSSELVNIGCHHDGSFSASYVDNTDQSKGTLPFITLTRLSNNKTITGNIDTTFVEITGLLDTEETKFPAGQTNSSIHVTLQGKYEGGGSKPYFWIQPNRSKTTAITCTISNVRMYVRDGTSAAAGHSRKAYVDLTVGTVIDDNTESGTNGPDRKYTLEIPVPIGQTSASAKQTVAVIDAERSDVRKYLEEYTTHHEKEESSTEDKTRLASNIASLNTQINELETQQKNYLEWKRKLNQLFFNKYSRFIQEGTWISEEYVDDEKYYADSQSVLYNSCYPQVAYTINVLELSGLPGYELFKFDLGDKTWAIDDEFFGDDHKEEVIITEIAERLDDPSKNRIKVQNFKNQFQDLFQKITATVQQTQYSTGAYEKGVALVNANEAKKNEFITSAINNAASFLAPGKSHTVTWEGGLGITVTDDKTPTNQVRIVGGAILLSAEDPVTKEQTWITGVTNQGISADLITAGRLDAGVVQIMSGNEPVFRWDSYGISAYDAVWYDEGTMKTISGINSKKFVRFDKNGIYGVDNIPGIDGATWHPMGYYKDNNGTRTWVTPGEEIQEKAAFYLTWDGMQVIPGNLSYTNNGILASGVRPKDFRLKMGRVDDYIYNAWDSAGLPYYNSTSKEPKFVKVFSIGDYAGADGTSENLVMYSDGTLVAEKIKLPGSIEWTEASSPSKNIYASESLTKPADGTKYSSFDDSQPEVGDKVWHKIWDSDNDTHYCHTDDGGATWQGPFLLTGRSIVSTDTFYAIGETGLSDDVLDEWEEPTANSASTYSLRRGARTVTKQWSTSIQEAGTVRPGECMYIKSRDNYNDGTVFVKYLASAIVTHNYTITLTNDSGIIVTNADGSGGGYGENVTTIVSVYDGDQVDSSWTFNASPDSENDFEWERTGENLDTFKINRMVADQGELTITATKDDCPTLTTVFKVSKLKQGNKGSDGGDAIVCYIDSSKGNLLLDTDTGTVKLTARIFIGEQEFENYANLQYSWYVEGELEPINADSDSGATTFNEQTITLNADYVRNNKTFYFTATEKQS